MRKLGEGGFGAVYEAYQPSLDRKIAVKVLHPELTRSPDAITRFRREGLIASRLQHPCTVEVFNLGQTEDGYLWLAMEYVEGITLEHYLKQHNTLEPQALFEIIAPVCDVLTEAHEKGVIHRDLKPDNIMLTTIGEQRLPKVLDFGIASLQGTESATNTNTVSGTPQYMAPEQWEGLSRVDARSDLYAVGVICYRALSGKLPFEADSALAWMKKHHLEEPLDLQDAMGETPVSPALRSAIMRMLSKEPSQRPQSARQLKAELQEAIQSSPVLPSSAAHGLQRPAYKRVYHETSKHALRSIIRSNNHDLYAVGEHGLIVHSDDNGESWDPIESQCEVAFFDIWATPAILCAVGMHGTILCSSDGVRWEPRVSKTRAALRAIWGAGERLFVVGEHGTVLQSEDTGRSWRSLPTGTRESFFTVWGFEHERELTLYIAGSRGMILCSRDLGGSWQRLENPLSSNISSLHGLSQEKLAMVTDDGHLLLSLDGERPRAFAACEAPLSRVRCLSDGRVIATATSGEFLITANGSRVSLGSLSRESLYGIFVEPGGLFFVGGNNTVIHYTDESDVYDERFKGAFPNLFGAYQDAGALYLCGDDGFMACSNDEGESWSIDQRPGFSSIYDVWRFAAGECVMMCGAAGYLELFDEKGGVWRVSGITQDLYCLWGSSATDVYVVGDHGAILHTVDSWGSKEERYSGVNVLLISIWGSGPEDIYVVGVGGLILHSSDGGYTWERQPSETQENLHCVFGLSSQDVFAVGAKGTILHSSNQGLSWQKRYSPTKETLSSIQGDHPNDLFICGESGTLLHSKDGGWTWRPWTTNTTLRLVGALRTASKVVVFGYSGVLLEYHQRREEQSPKEPLKTLEQPALPGG